jgi:anti-sigma B factor antagonist
MALEIRVSTIDGVAVWAPTGRFDASGADGFDRKVSELDAATQWMILDMNRVTYLSSGGIRSLVKLGKLLQQRKGRVVISGASEFVGQTMSMAGLRSFLHTAPSVPEAARLIATEEKAARPCELGLTGWPDGTPRQ